MLTRLTDHLHAWAEKHARTLFPVLVVATALLALALRATHLTDTPTRSPDERLYTQFAQQIAQGGLGAYESIFQNYAADPSQWIYPSPTRIAHVLLFSGVMKVTGASSAQAGAAVSWVLGIGSVLLVAFLGRRFFGRFVGVIAALLLATMVVEAEFARRAWGESTASFLALLLVYAALALEQEPARWARRIAFFAVGTLCLLAKETCIFAYALCGCWLLARRLFVARDNRGALGLVVGAALSGLVTFGVLAWLAGSPRLVLDGWVHVFGNGLGSNEWGSLYASGPWYQFLYLLWLVGPLSAVLALGGMLTVLLASRLPRVFDELEPGARAAAGLCVLLTLGFVAACAFGPSLQYLRIMAPANPSYCLLGAIGLRALLALVEDQGLGKLYPLALGAVAAAFVAIGVHDYSLYRDVIVRPGMQDLAVRWIIDGVERRDRRVLDSSRQALEAASTPVPLAPAPPLAPGVPAPAATSEAHLARSVELCRTARYAECVSAAQAALMLNPRLPEAWNNAAAGYAGLRLWDDAIRSANQALRLRSDFQLAKNNLAWATDEKSKQLALLQ